jgi:hypothetical protein
LDTQPIWFTARLANKNIGYFEAVPIGVDPVSGMVDYRIEIDGEVLIVAHHPDKSVWHLLYRALDVSLFDSEDDTPAEL